MPPRQYGYEFDAPATFRPPRSRRYGGDRDETDYSELGGQFTDQAAYDFSQGQGAGGMAAAAPAPAYAGGVVPVSEVGGGPYDKFRQAQANAEAERAAARGPYEGYGASNAFVGPEGFSANQGVGAVLADFYRQGAFDPSGGGAYLDAMKRMLGEQEQQDVAQAGLAADLYGGDDPLARIYGRLKAEQGARNRYPGLIAQAQAQAAARREQQIYSLLQQRLGGVDYLRDPKTDWGAVVGQIGGTAAGALLGGPAGAAAGGAAGGAIGGAAGGGGGGRSSYYGDPDYYGNYG